MKILSLVAIAALVVSVTVRATQEDTSKPPSPQPTAYEGDQKPQVGIPTGTSGKITSLHTLNLVGMTEPHVLVKILTDDGETDIADLGAAAALKSDGFEPREGQQLWISGRVGRINDKFLIVAENISESKLMTITRTAPLREESEKHAAARGEGPSAAAEKDGKENKTESFDAGLQVRTIEGTVIHTRNMKLDGEPEEHTLAKLQTEKGIVVVDLGAATTLPKINLSKGQWLAASGFVGHLNNKPIIVAESIGNMSSVSRAAAPAAAKNACSDK